MHSIYRAIDGLNEAIGRVVAWLTLGMVLFQFVVVLQRYIFSIGSLYMQESIVYMHGILIMLAAGYTYLHNGHVRVDITYREASQRKKDWIDLIGNLVFLIPVCYIIWWSAWPNVESSWATKEGSTESSGIPYKYLLKSTVLVFALLLGLQAVSAAIKSVLRLMGHTVHDPYANEEAH
jgi:TRAP-type mannitol/chloroaromatic compound transport system permease small subunit